MSTTSCWLPLPPSASWSSARARFARLLLDGSAALITRAGLVVTSSDAEAMAVGQAISEDLRDWVTAVRELHATGPAGARLSWVPTLDWLLLEL
jgi:hypothetical protein